MWFLAEKLPCVDSSGGGCVSLVCVGLGLRLCILGPNLGGVFFRPGRGGLVFSQFDDSNFLSNLIFYFLFHHFKKIIYI